MCDQCPSPDSDLQRRNFLKLAGAAALGSLLAPTLASAADPGAVPPKPQNAISPREALERLVKGNKRYINGSSRRQDFVAERAALALGQNPFAGVLGCADSRVAPELAFDTGRGDLFVCRVAGNFANADTIASFEYGVAVLGLPLILVLGHGACGAVDSTIKTVKDGTKFPGHIPSLINALKPAVKQTLDQPGDLLANATRRNVTLTVERLKNATPILSKAVSGGKLLIAGGVYELETGRVTLLSS